MIHFTRLRLSGFKSFVDPVDVPIQPGMTGIVGPNGCGKSNLVEALIWVMGENSARNLRGGEMDDVIFAGTTSRPSRNLAEVSLILDNTTRAAPAAFNDSDEIEVLRRIERDRFSTYRINGREVRARDVQTLFADAASGARSPAFINQGRIGALITARPSDRRGLLEEAAGIGGLAVRRHEAETRLRAAEANLTRLEDVVTALAGQLGSLRRQARQAARYREIAGLVRKAESRLLAARWRLARNILAEAEKAIAESADIVIRLTAEAAAAATAEVNATTALPALQAAESDAAAKRQQVVAFRDALAAEEARVAAAEREVIRQLTQIAADHERETALSHDATQALARLEEERLALAEQSGAEVAAERSAQEEESGAAKAAQAAEAALNQALANQAAASAAREAASRARIAAEARHQQLVARSADLARQLQSARAALTDDVRLAGLAKEVEAATLRVETSRTLVEEADRAREAARVERDKGREAAQAAAATLSGLRAEISALMSLNAPTVKGAHHPILESVLVAPGYEAALGAALGEDLSAPAEVTAPISWHKLPPLEDSPPLPAGCISLAGFAEAPPELARRLAQIGVIENAAEATALQPLLLSGQRLVSRAGDLWRWDGFVARAGAPSAASARLRQRNRLRELEPKRLEAEQEVAAHELSARAANALVEQTSQTEKKARDDSRASEAELHRLRQSLARLTEAEAAARSRLAGLTEQESAIAGHRAEAEAALASATQALAELPPPDTSGVAGLRSALAERHGALVGARAHLDRLRHEVEARRRRLASILVEAESWRRRTAAAQTQLVELAARRGVAEIERDRLAGMPATFEARRLSLRDELAEADEARKRAAAALADAIQHQSAAARQRRDAEQSLARAREEDVRRTAAGEAATRTLHALDDSVRERFGVSAEALAEEEGNPGPDAIPEAERRHERLARERDAVGPVNLRAEEELAELEAKIASLEAERDDLVAAIAKLRHAISELNRQSRERLLASFTEVDRHFRDLFTRLFGGGRAQLSLTEADDPLEAGLEVVASPPGKRLQTLSLLSGGEQALTALALLFAVFMTNPAPICVLDEVDAPLDDANVDRFCKLVGDIAAIAHTRFLVVTHHRMTMARVDRLFGVTMVERGMSNLVSVDLEAAVRLREPV